MALLLTIAVDEPTRQALQQAGHRVAAVDDPVAAVEALSRARVDLVLHRGDVPPAGLMAAVVAARAGILVQLPGDDGTRAAQVPGADDWLAGDAPTHAVVSRVAGRLRALAEEAARRHRLGHDLRGAVSLVSGHAELLSSFDWSRHPAGGELVESLDAISSAAATLGRLIHERVEPPPAATGGS